MRLSNKTILITGAGNGMGQQLVIEAINRGAKVVAIDLDKRSLTQSKKLAMASDSNFYPIVLDITDSKKIGQLP